MRLITNELVKQTNKLGHSDVIETLKEPLAHIVVHQVPLGSIGIHCDQLGSICIHSVPLGSFLIYQDLLGSIRIYQDALGSIGTIGILWERLGSIRMDNNISGELYGSPWIHLDPLESIGIHWKYGDPLGFIGIHPDPFGSIRIYQGQLTSTVIL